MPSNAKKRGTNISQSFTKQEVEAAVQLFDILSRGGDAAVIVQSEPIRKMHGKFKRMSMKLNRKTHPIDDDEWLGRLQQQVRGFEVYGPNDEPNPSPGSYTIVGPLSEYRHSSRGYGHAAMLYLAQVCRDRVAIDALRLL